MWDKSYDTYFKITQDMHLIFLHYIILNQILGTGSLLFSMGISKEIKWRICGDSEETDIFNQ